MKIRQIIRRHLTRWLYQHGLEIDARDLSQSQIGIFTNSHASWYGQHELKMRFHKMSPNGTKVIWKVHVLLSPRQAQILRDDLTSALDAEARR